MRRIVVGYSGGVTSAWCLDWALRTFPREEVVALFHGFGCVASLESVSCRLVHHPFLLRRLAAPSARPSRLASPFTLPQVERHVNPLKLGNSPQT